MENEKVELVLSFIQHSRIGLQSVAYIYKPKISVWFHTCIRAHKRSAELPNFRWRESAESSTCTGKNNKRLKKNIYLRNCAPQVYYKVWMEILLF